MGEEKPAASFSSQHKCRFFTTIFARMPPPNQARRRHRKGRRKWSDAEKWRLVHSDSANHYSDGSTARLRARTDARRK